MTLVDLNSGLPDKDHLRRLYVEHGRGLIAFACTFVSGFAAGEDVLHRVFERLLRGGIELGGSPVSYLYRAVRNECLNYIRDRARETHFEDAWLESPPGREGEALLLQSALRELPEEQREVIVLRVWGKLTLDDVADTLGISPKTAASR